MKKRSIIWDHYGDLSMVPNKVERTKCKYCGVSFLSTSFYRIGNFMSYYEKCPKKVNRDVGQMIIDKTKERYMVRSINYDPKIFRDLVTRVSIMHDLSF